MFENEIEKMTRGERDMFKKVANHLLYTSFITRRTYDKTTKMFKTNQMYIFIEQYYSLFEDYFSFVDIDINKDDQDGVIYTSSISEYNQLRIDVPSTLLVFALRSYYEGEVSKNPSESFILMNNIQVMNLINELGLSNLSKRISSSTVSSSLSYLNSYNILIVEDEVDIARAIEAYLNNQGYKTFMAGNGIEGLEVLSKEEIHLAIVDVMMPKMDGITFVMKLREKYDFPVIMLSAKSEEVDYNGYAY